MNNIILSSLHIYDMKTYLQEFFSKDLDEFAKSNNLKTGYANLDAITSLYPGLYVLGAISSLGKTTFVHQMADQLAQMGNPVIYFSLEQSTLELATKSLSRIIAKSDAPQRFTSLQIRKSGNPQMVLEAVKEYLTYAENLEIVECSFRATIDDITCHVEDYIKKHEAKPIVIIDYLQVIQPVPGLNAKEAVDYNICRLKQLQSDNKLVLFVISSLNRQNYMSQIDFESFKESGGIEYTADVLWGLQLQVLHDKIFDLQGQIQTKRQIVREAKATNPRKIELVCLKNRFGISSYSCCFDYYAAFDLFEADRSDIDASSIPGYPPLNDIK